MDSLAVEILSDLVSARSVDGDELECQQRVASWMRKFGGEVSLFEIDLQALSETPGYLKPHAAYEGRPNVVGRWRRAGTPGRTLILNSHADVVDAGDPGRWTTNPWQPRLESGKLFARGAADAKGCLTAALLAVAGLVEQRVPFGGELLIQSVVDEESTGNGTLECLRRGIVGDAAIVLEPTSLNVCSGHRGARGLHFSVVGEAGHAGGRGGRSAIRLASLLIGRLEALNSDWARRYGGGMFDIPRLNVGVVSGGESIYVVPDKCEFWVGVRYTSSQIEALLADVQRTVREVSDEAGMPGTVCSEEFSDVDPMPWDETTWVVRQLAACASHVCGRERPVEPFQAGCDARHFGRYNIPTAIFGPGSLSTAHASDEYIHIDELVRAAKILALFIVSGWESKGDGAA